MRFILIFIVSFFLFSSYSLAEDESNLADSPEFDQLLQNPDLGNNFSNTAEIDSAIDSYIEGRSFSEFFRERDIGFNEGSEVIRQVHGENADSVIGNYRDFEVLSGLTPGDQNSESVNQMRVIDEQVGDTFNEIGNASDENGLLNTLSEDFDLTQSGLSQETISNLQQDHNLTYGDITALSGAAQGNNTALINSNLINRASPETTQMLSSNFPDIISNGQNLSGNLDNSINQLNSTGNITPDSLAGVETQADYYNSYLDSSLNTVTNSMTHPQ